MRICHFSAGQAKNLFPMAEAEEMMKKGLVIRGRAQVEGVRVQEILFLCEEILNGREIDRRREAVVSIRFPGGHTGIINRVKPPFFAEPFQGLDLPRENFPLFDEKGKGPPGADGQKMVFRRLPDRSQASFRRETSRNSLLGGGRR